MTPEKLDEIKAAASSWADRSRREQGLPPMITDPATLAKIAVLLKAGS